MVGHNCSSEGMTALLSERPITMAVVLEKQRASGGSFQHALDIAALIAKLPGDLCTPVFFTTTDEIDSALREHGLEAHSLKFGRSNRAVHHLRRWIGNRPGASAFQALSGSSWLERQFSMFKVDIVFFPTVSGLPLLLERMNFIFSLLDLCHRDHPEFPEVRDNWQFEGRERLLRSVLPKSTAVLVDAVAGKRNVIRCYGLDAARVHVFPFAPSIALTAGSHELDRDRIDVKTKYGLSTDYLFYPAQFWPHKNHVYLLDGMRALEDVYGIRMSAIFVGSDAGGNLAYIKRVAQELGLEERVRTPGYVEDREMPYLYRQAFALAMPTYFGPTNLPPMEAFSLGVPVIYSDRSDLRAQVGQAALLVDLSDPRSLADRIYRLMSEPGCREELVRQGRQQLLASHSDESRLKTLQAIIRDFRARRRCWP
jgi:glycosyltransferase involved in cell wall biosynthesis